MLSIQNNSKAFTLRLLRSFCPPHLLEEIEGDRLKQLIVFFSNNILKHIIHDVNAANVHKTLPFQKQQWTSIFPDRPFDYFLLDEFFNRQYKQEQHFQLMLKHE